MWALKGGCTGPEAMTIMKEKHDMRSAAETEKAVRATARQALRYLTLRKVSIISSVY